MTSHFLRALAHRTPARRDRRWIYVPYDQLTDQCGPLAEHAPEELGIVMLESPGKASRRPYHRQKLALVLANGRQFALEQAARGVAVRWGVAGADGYAGSLRALARELGPLTMMEAAERELRVELAPLIDEGCLQVVPHAGWLTDEDEFRAACPEPPWRMDAFYRALRRRRGWLMEKGKPLGGKWSYDADNRKPWRGQPAAPTPLRFTPDAITTEVLELVAREFAAHPGSLDGSTLPATAADSERLWSWAKEECLPQFGPYEDAMSDRSSGLFHSRVSALLNLQRLSAHRLVDDALSLPIELASQEGFLRQVAGWREYMRHVHRATDGFRALPDPRAGALPHPGDGGYARWAGAPWPKPQDGDGGSNVSQLVAHQPLPPAYWGRESGLHCLDTVVAQVWSEGYSHHITRLMVLANFATLLGVSPRELTDWFWVAYLDAYDWVVEPNVLAMGTFGAGDLITTKPYIAGSAYIDRMSDYCKSCRFDPRKNCPFTPLYWAFLARHRGALERVARMDMPLRSLGARSGQLRARDRSILGWVQQTLAAGATLRVEDVP